MEDEDSNKKTSKSENKDDSDKDESKEKLIKRENTDFEDAKNARDVSNQNRGRSNKIAPI